MSNTFDNPGDDPLEAIIGADIPEDQPESTDDIQDDDPLDEPTEEPEDNQDDEPEEPEDPILGETYGNIAVPKKFQGKKLSAFLESYNNLESRLGKPARTVEARKAMATVGLTPETIDAMELPDDIIKYLDSLDYTKMDPRDFAKIFTKISISESRRRILEEQRYQQEVQAKNNEQIADAVKEYPMLKSVPEFRAQVAAYLRNSNKDVTIKEACEAVTNAFKAFQNASGTPPTPKAKPRTTVETPSERVPAQPADDGVLSGILGAGGGSVLGR